jgi:hypothetical protein
MSRGLLAGAGLEGALTAPAGSIPIWRAKRHRQN